MESSNPGMRAADLIRRLREKLPDIRDGRGRPAVISAYAGTDIYHGETDDNRPDLIVGYHPGFRCSWQTALGGVPSGEVLTPNEKKWTGDHLMDPMSGSRMLFLLFRDPAPGRIHPGYRPDDPDPPGLEIPQAFEGKSLA